MENIQNQQVNILSLSLDGFEGPIDLLLSLARDHKIDLTKLQKTLREELENFLY